MRAHRYLVLNAGCKDKDMAHLNVQLAAFQKKGGDCQITEMKQHALVALQVRVSGVMRAVCGVRCAVCCVF